MKQIEGTPIEENAVINFATRTTALAGISTGDTDTVLFIGTDHGHLKKLVLETKYTAKEYEDINLDDNSAVNADMPLVSNGMHLYVMTDTRVPK